MLKQRTKLTSRTRGWVRDRNENGEYGWRNLLTHLFTTTNPTTGALQSTESTIGQTMLRQAFNSSTLRGRHQIALHVADSRNQRNYRSKTTNEMAQIHPLYTSKAIVTLDLNGEPVIQTAQLQQQGPGGLVSVGNTPYTLPFVFLNSLSGGDIEQEGLELVDLGIGTFPFGLAFRSGYMMLPGTVKLAAPTGFKNWMLNAELKEFPLTITAGEYELPNNLGWGPKQTINVRHASETAEPLTLFKAPSMINLDEYPSPLETIDYLRAAGLSPKLNIIDNIKSRLGKYQFSGNKYRFEVPFTINKNSSVLKYIDWLHGKFNITPQYKDPHVEWLGAEAGGIYRPNGEVALNPSNAQDFASVAVHEIASHGTDAQVGASTLKLYEDLAKLIGVNELGREVRATLNELRKYLFDTKGYPKNLKQLNAMVDDYVDNGSYLDDLFNVNGYGRNMASLYNNLREHGYNPELYLSKFRNASKVALKTLPAFTGYTLLPKLK